MDCTFQTEKGRFNYRVGAIITSEIGRLFVKNSKEPYFYSIGGGVKLQETMDEAIEREVYEETGVLIKHKTLGFIHENFFTLDLTGEDYHEISFYYYIELMEDTILKASDELEHLSWIPFEKLPQTDIRPAFLKKLTKDQKMNIQHLVERG
ncbi:NUDIX hydrolase [Enterococcus sp. LJL99]